MAKQFIEIENLSNEEGGEMFTAICEKVLKKSEAHMKEALGIPTATPVTTKDLVSLIQEAKMQCKLTVYFDDEAQQPEIQKELPLKKDSETVEEKGPGETPVGEKAKTGDDLPF